MNETHNSIKLRTDKLIKKSGSNKSVIHSKICNIYYLSFNNYVSLLAIEQLQSKLASLEKSQIQVGYIQQ